MPKSSHSSCPHPHSLHSSWQNFKSKSLLSGNVVSCMTDCNSHCSDVTSLLSCIYSLVFVLIQSLSFPNRALLWLKSEQEFIFVNSVLANKVHDRKRCYKSTWTCTKGNRTAWLHYRSIFQDFFISTRIRDLIANQYLQPQQPLHC